jgi:cob(I)alamin adenosyltransferase
MGKERGYVVVITGDGKGKTTTALGMALRSVGHRQKVIMLQFIKGSTHYGEITAAQRLAPYFEMLPLGRGFVRHVGQRKPGKKHMEAAQEAWKISRQKILSGDYCMVILDEINNAIAYGLLPLADVLETLKGRPPEVTVVLTGRGAHPDLIHMADLVTEEKEIKHPFHKGRKAKRGIEF